MPELDEAALSAVRQWEFAAPTIAGAAVPVAMSVTFAFQEDRGRVEEVVRIGGAGEITEPRKIKHVPPVFPPDAQRQRIQGVIVLETVIDRDGKVGSIRILRSAGDLLDRAAADAVRQWEYTPTKLYGVPVPVAMTVTVSFSINWGSGLVLHHFLDGHWQDVAIQDLTPLAPGRLEPNISGVGGV